jgi:hypothetical protein
MTAMPIETKQQETTLEPSDLEFETTKLSIVKAGLEEMKNNKNPVWQSTSDMDNWFNAQRQSIK